VGDEHLSALVDAALVGGADDMERLLVEIRPKVLRQCSRVLPDRFDAEEACQDALVSVSRRLASFEGRASFETWLYRLTANAALDTYRILRRRSETFDPTTIEAESISRTSVIAGTRIDLLEALSKVDERISTPVIMRDVLSLPYDEIARELGVPEGTIKSRIHDGRQALQRLLAAHD
jgi:RNA polymerase sigma-70 factor (ECF subfamily)